MSPLSNFKSLRQKRTSNKTAFLLSTLAQMRQSTLLVNDEANQEQAAAASWATLETQYEYRRLIDLLTQMLEKQAEASMT